MSCSVIDCTVVERDGLEWKGVERNVERNAAYWNCSCGCTYSVVESGIV